MQFQKIIGHQAFKSQLIQSVKDNRISHAQLFSGSAGTGTLALAIAYSQYINCENKISGDSCGKCPSCTKMNKLVHPDVHFSYPVAGPNKPKSIDFIVQWREAIIENPYLEIHDWYESLSIENKQGFMSVEESADLLRKLSLKSFEAEYKTAIIWLPEKMRTDASNKLLKIIEEPPDKTLFILVTENPEQIIPTILSRTQLSKTYRIGDSEIIEALTAGFQINADEAFKIAQLCDGNFNIALKLAGNETKDHQGEMEFIDWMRICFNPFKSYPSLMDKVDRFAKLPREDQKNYLSFCMAIIRECLMMNFNVKALQRFGEKGYTYFEKFSQMIHTDNAPLFIEELNKAYIHVERNANAKILFLDLSFKIYRILTIKKPNPSESFA